MLETKTIQYPRVAALNVGRQERWGAFVGGVLMVLLAFWRKSPLTIALLPVGLYMLYRGAAGHCYVYEYFGISTLHPREPVVEEVPPTGVGPEDEVAESSWESFPTSDAPAWTMGRRDR